MNFYLIKNKKSGMFLNGQGKYVDHPSDATWYNNLTPCVSEVNRRSYCESIEIVELKVSKVIL